MSTKLGYEWRDVSYTLAYACNHTKLVTRKHTNLTDATIAKRKADAAKTLCRLCREDADEAYNDREEMSVHNHTYRRMPKGGAE